MDALDRKITALLAEDGRMSITDLADLLPLSISATRERLRRLETSGVIDGYSARINPSALGRSIEALVDVRLAQSTTTEQAESSVADMSAVVHAMHVTGRFDMLLRVVAADVGELDTLLTQLREEAGAEETNTRLVLRTLDQFPRAPAL